jgi:hypothetical protein
MPNFGEGGGSKNYTNKIKESFLQTTVSWHNHLVVEIHLNTVFCEVKPMAIIHMI